MSLTVSKDLLVTTAPGDVEKKLEEKQNALRESILKGEPKIFGVSQIVIGFLIISYSFPLFFGEATLVINIGVPWWSGLMFVLSGSLAIAVEKGSSLKTLTVCLAVSIVAIIISVIALALYFIDIRYNQISEQNFSNAVKQFISILIMTQTGLSSAFTAIMYKQRKNFAGYATVNE